MQKWLMLLLLGAIGCASVQSSSQDSDPAGTTYLIRVNIINGRTQDVNDPVIYLYGTGRHSLGIVRGMDGNITKLIDSRWLGADGCMTITAHYSGTGNLVFDRFCWRKGEIIDIQLTSPFNPVAAWAHR